MKLKLREFICLDLPSGWHPYYIYDMYCHKEIVGTLTFRTGTNVDNYYGGHIGYSVEPEFRGNGYAYEALLCLEPFIVEQGYREVILTCDPKNIASKKTIEKLATFIETKEIPKKYKKEFTKEEKIKDIYLWKIIE